MNTAATQPLACPRSASVFWENLVALGIALAGFACLQTLWPMRSGDNAVDATILTGVGLAINALWRHQSARQPSSGLSLHAPLPRSSTRIAVRLLGVGLTIGAIAGAYALFPEYAGGFYKPFWHTLTRYAVPVLLSICIYVYWIDAYLPTPRDPYHHLAQVCLRRAGTIDTALLKNHFLSSLVKAFFIPLMVVYLWQNGEQLAIQYQQLAYGSFAWFEFGFQAGYFIDLIFCVIGYVFALRVLDSHIKNTESTTWGWLVAIICYQPFFSIIESQYLRYEDGYQWGAWLASYHYLKMGYGLVIILLVLIYGFCTVAFGLRFSNLTYRGIITSGPYRYSKHPAYISKNISWWLISIPFVSLANPAEAGRFCLHLLLVNAIYYARAKAEERHLGQDPQYVVYALWMNTHGMFARLGKIFPRMQYRPPIKAG